MLVSVEVRGEGSRYCYWIGEGTIGAGGDFFVWPFQPFPFSFWPLVRSPIGTGSYVHDFPAWDGERPLPSFIPQYLIFDLSFIILQIPFRPKE